MGIEEYGAKPSAVNNKETEVTVKDILADKKQSSLFGEFIKTQPGGQERAERLLKGEPTPDDMQKLTEQKEQFFERQKEAEKLLKAFTPELIGQLAGQSSQLEILVKAGGVEGVHGAIASQLEMLSMKDPARFDSILESCNDLLKKAESANEIIETICKTHGIDSKKYLEILAHTPDEVERQKKIGDMIRPTLGAVKEWRAKTIEKNKQLQNENVAEKAKDADYKWAIDKMRAEYDQELEQVGDVLALSINEDASMKKAFISALLSEKAPAQEKFGSFKEMRGMMPEEGDLKKDWEAEWKEADAMGVDRGEFRHAFAANKVGSKKGPWSDIIKEFIMKLTV